MRCGILVAVGGVGAMAMGMLVGCGPRAVVSDPSAITLKSALTEVGEGLAAMVKSQPQSSDYGIYPAEVTVSFNVAASGTASGTLLLTPSFPAVSEGERSGAKASVGETASRANTVTVKFVNVLFAPPDSLVQHVSGAQLFELRQAMLGIDPRSVMTPVQMEVGSAKRAAPAPTPAPTVPASAIPVSPVSEVGSAPPPSRASIPAMKFLSPFKAEEDPSALIRGLAPERLAQLARAMNAKVGMEVVRPDAPEPELRRQVEDAANRLIIKSAEIQTMLAGQK